MKKVEVLTFCFVCLIYSCKIKNKFYSEKNIFCECIDTIRINKGISLKYSKNSGKSIELFKITFYKTFNRKVYYVLERDENNKIRRKGNALIVKNPYKMDRISIYDSICNKKYFVMDGVWKYYDIDGCLTNESVYKNGILKTSGPISFYDSLCNLKQVVDIFIDK